MLNLSYFPVVPSMMAWPLLVCLFPNMAAGALPSHLHLRQPILEPSHDEYYFAHSCPIGNQYWIARPFQRKVYPSLL
jgi:hypothetical protein